MFQMPSSVLKQHGAAVEYIECWLPKDECIANVYRKPGVTPGEAARHIGLIERAWRPA